MLTGLAAECTATYSLSKYNFHQTHVEEATNFVATELNNDLINSAISTICFCVFVATLFGADFFFLVFWPRRRYPAWYRHARLTLAVGITLGMFGSAIASTIIIATQSARIVGVDPGRTQELVDQFFRPPLRYRSWPQNIAWVVLLWVASIFTLASTILMFKAATHDEKYGTEPRARERVLSPPPARKSRSIGNGEGSMIDERKAEKGGVETVKDESSSV
ncbi:hypothetical protein EST38_g5642 [Candolleomyces aberdarensis]|uniref:Uncharacterized protein n=1 Tax=Candolleomyces aberdarensis TaxID=2316362 RepID=A0A4Q2DN73_9AGAR|nr:hypothetical protein EST38_g5642 [Candolleomyces aberdarensis]